MSHILDGRGRPCRRICSDANVVFVHRMGAQVVLVVEIRVANVAPVSGHLAAFVSGVPAQRIPVLVPFAARFARPTFVWKTPKANRTVKRRR